jgi:hypothetical protein
VLDGTESVLLDSLAQRDGKHKVSVFRLTNISPIIHNEQSRDSSVGIATRYGLDGPGIESRWGRDFLHLSRPSLGPTQPPIQWYRVFPGDTAGGAWR